MIKRSIKHVLIGIAGVITIYSVFRAYEVAVPYTVEVQDSDGQAVANARVVVLHANVSSTPAAYIGVTDQQGRFQFSMKSGAHPLGGLSFHAVSPSNLGGSASPSQLARHVIITVESPTELLKDYYVYESPEKVWTEVSRFVGPKAWQLEPGQSRYYPIASLQAQEQRRFRKERWGH